MKSLAGGFLFVVATAAAGHAQGATTLGMERRSYADWLATSPTSPLAAVAMHRLGGTVTLGSDTSDIPLAGIGNATVTEQRGAYFFAGSDGKSRLLPWGRSVVISPWTLQVLGTGSASVLMVYGKPHGTPPGWYPADSTRNFVVTLQPPATTERRRVLTLEGIEVQAETAGHISVPLGAGASRLLVMRLPVPGTEETELQVYFRDQTNDHGTYPAGRFVELIRQSDGTYRIDFNRARNPFCAYSSVYPCPVPWTGNAIAAPVDAGEKYLPHPPGS